MAEPPRALEEHEVREQVRAFYDAVGWSQVGEGLYQNARHEDLRPVAREYIHRCHLRFGQALPSGGRRLLDAGSGPVQYPEYLEYSRGFGRRVCLDISRTALREARARLGPHGACVVGDLAALPFRAGAFEAVPPDGQEGAFRQLARVLAPGGTAAVVYSWGAHAPAMRLMGPAIRLAFAVQRLVRRMRGEPTAPAAPAAAEARGAGTYSHKHPHAWVRRRLGDLPGLEIRVWRSVSTAFLRAFIHRRLLGRQWLRLIFALEQAAPRWMGRVGQYPLIVFRKPAGPAAAGVPGR
jgi:SAM-dependent methyltransferase